MNTSIKIKPHHFIDIISSFASDEIILKPHPYGHKVHSITKEIINNKELVLEIELHADTICEPCCHNIEGICSDSLDTSNRPLSPSLKREWNLLIDKRWCKRLNITQGDKIPILNFCNILKENTKNIADIYRERTIDNSNEKEKKLNEGLKKYMEQTIEYKMK